MTCLSPIGHCVPLAGPRLNEFTDLAPLRNQRVVVVSDDENVRLGALRHGRRFSYGLLLRRLANEARPVTAISVITAVRGDHKREKYLESRGWKPLVLPREKSSGPRGIQTHTNVDTDLAVEVGYALARHHFDVLVILSGDGMLCRSCAQAVRRHRPEVRVVTIALPGTASRDLWRRRDLFAAHIPIGRDLTRPLSPNDQPSTSKYHV